jgi:hydroxyacylglutathione hydrolase
MAADINISPIPAFNDNYLWLIDDDKGHAVILDPGDATPVIKVLKERKLTLRAILITHHHNDHIGGINSLLEYENVPVYGPNTGKIPQITNPIKHGDSISLFNGSLVFETLEVPGHTQEHIAYFGQINEQPVLFPGDTLFAAGCGRLLGGTHQQLFHSLSMINLLPETTKIFSSHEYTLANLNFAQAVEPNNGDIQQRIRDEEQKRAENRPTLPTNLKLERLTNPFLRVDQASVAQSVKQYWNQDWSSAEDLFGALRKWKDSF